MSTRCTVGLWGPEHRCLHLYYDVIHRRYELEWESVSPRGGNYWVVPVLPRLISRLVRKGWL